MATTEAPPADTGERDAPAEKVAVVEEVAGALSEAAAIILVDYRGLTVGQLAELRAGLREADATCRVVKNTLTERAADQAGVAGMADFLVGPTALVLCHEGPVAPAKALSDFTEEHPDLELKAALLEGQVLGSEEAGGLADLRSRDELLTSLAGMMNNALATFARLMQAKVVDLGRLLEALREERSGEEEPAAEGGEPAAEAEEPEAEADEAAEEADEGEAEAAGGDEPEAGTSDEDEPETAEGDEPEAETTDEQDEAGASDEDEPDEADEDDDAEDPGEAASDGDGGDEADTDDGEDDDGAGAPEGDDAGPDAGDPDED